MNIIQYESYPVNPAQQVDPDQTTQRGLQYPDTTIL